MLKPVPAQTRILESCQRHWDAYKSDCSGFARAVAADFGVALPGQANQQIDLISKGPWKQLGHDGVAAQTYANNNYLVIGGLKAFPNGHVVVAVRAALSPYPPVAYWGRLGGVGGKFSGMNWAFKKQDIPFVSYAAIAVA